MLSNEKENHRCFTRRKGNLVSLGHVAISKRLSVNRIHIKYKNKLHVSYISKHTMNVNVGNLVEGDYRIAL